jgi:ABC-2 type transport system ATP-binding protein
LAISRRSLELMAKLNLLEAQRRPLRTFSKGMLQRAAICFALLHDPSVVILDEPMSGLDPIGRKMVLDLVMELKEAGKTVFFCSHILGDVERLCDRIGLMVRGRLAGVYERKDFALCSQGLVHLAVPSLSEGQRAKLEPMLKGVHEHRHEQILASRSENFSLEELFMKVVEEQNT